MGVVSLYCCAGLGFLHIQNINVCDKKRLKCLKLNNLVEHVVGIDQKLLTCYNLSTDSIGIGGLDYEYIG